MRKLQGLRNLLTTASLAALLVLVGPGGAFAEQILVVTTGNLMGSFDSATPGVVTGVVATTTTLFGIDSNLDVLVRQGSVDGTPVSPNTGQLFTVGPLGVNTTNLVGFDISGTTGTAYAALSTGPQ